MSGPTPPVDLATRTPHLLTLEAGDILNRFYTLGDGARTFDPVFYDRSPGGRFNAPDGSYGVLYTAKRPYGAFAETFLRTSGRRMVDRGLMARKGFATLRVLRRVALVAFDGPRLAALGATAAVSHCDPPYGNSQAWSAALRSHPAGADGIAYSSRHDPSEVCYAIFEHRDDPVAEIDRDVGLDADWFWRLADHYEVGIAP